MVDKKQDLSVVSYILGIVSIVLAFFQPIAGFILGIIGLNMSKKQKGTLSQKAKKYNTIGIIIAIIIFIIAIILAILGSQWAPGFT